MDYFIFINLLSAYDNTGRNVFLGYIQCKSHFITQVHYSATGLGWYTWDALGMPLSLIPKKVLVLTTG
ncbi:hypothetical protein NXV12_31120 [Bacteroides thetaiotaomicron]|nr:hypothetical protein [Bacteroides thetaiotaomicron]